MVFAMVMGKRIGILTSGGDCAGLNAAIRAAVCRAGGLGWTVIGIREGTLGLMERPLQYDVLLPEMFNGVIMRQGGTLLGSTTRGNPFAFPMPDGTTKDRSGEIIDGYHELDLDALIVIGGDGSFRILRQLAQRGDIKLVAIPKTIDNDLRATDVTFGFDTAVSIATEALDRLHSTAQSHHRVMIVETMGRYAGWIALYAVAAEALDRLQPTAASHHRVMVLEVMGRDAGHIALSAGIAGGADVILIPEVPYSMTCIADRIRRLREDHNRNFALVVVSEAVRTMEGTALEAEYAGGEKRFLGSGAYIAAEIAQATGAETRVTVLGHVQRGSMPGWRDRLVASAFGVHAVDLIAEGKFDRMVGWSHRAIIDVPIEEAIARYRAVDADDPLLVTARHLGICLGDA